VVANFDGVDHNLAKPTALAKESKSAVQCVRTTLNWPSYGCPGLGMENGIVHRRLERTSNRGTREKNRGGISRSKKGLL